VTIVLFVEFVVLTEVVVKSSIFWDKMPHSLFKVNRHFGGKCRFHSQGRRINQARNQHEAGRSACCLFHGGFFLGLFFEPKDGGDL
jgi:hypothetical protein